NESLGGPAALQPARCDCAAQSTSSFSIPGETPMKALCWHGNNDVRVDTVPDPKIQAPTDCIVKVTTTAICGSDLHLLDGFMPTMKAGDILGHEFMGEVVEVGAAVKKRKVGDRVLVP